MRFVRQFLVLLGSELCLSSQDMSELFIPNVPVPRVVEVLVWNNITFLVSNIQRVYPQPGDYTSSGRNSSSMSGLGLNFHKLVEELAYYCSGTFVGFQGKGDHFGEQIANHVAFKHCKDLWPSSGNLWTGTGLCLGWISTWKFPWVRVVLVNP